MPKDETAEDAFTQEDAFEPDHDGLDPDEDGEGRRSRWRRLTSRLMDRRELSNDTKVLLSTVLATSDKAKTEAVRMVAREVRSYLDALELKEAVQEVMTSYSLEISVSLKPLAEAIEPDVPEPDAEEAEDDAGSDPGDDAVE